MCARTSRNGSRSRARATSSSNNGATLIHSWETTMRVPLQGLALLLTLCALPAAAETARIYVTNSAGDSIHVIDPATQKVVQVIEGIEGAHGIDFSPDGRRVYVSTEADLTLDVFDRAGGRRVTKGRL